jgi:hypothetical protein
MSTYTAIIGDVNSVGSSLLAAMDPGAASRHRNNPAVAAARIRNVQAPHIVSDAIGGLVSCDFTIPPWEAQVNRAWLRFGCSVWLFDGSTPIFYGYAEKPSFAADGSALMNLNGPWLLLQQARMREIWDQWDMSAMQKGTGLNENKAGQFTVNSDGSATFSFPNGSTVGNSDRCSADYLLFGEVSGAHDAKLITAFEFDITDSLGLGVNRRFRVIGKATAAAGTGDLLYDTAANGGSGRQGALNLNGTNQSGAWPSATGYRCLRFEFFFTVAAPVTLTQDNYVTLDRIRLSTREALFPSSGATIDTAAIARDILTLHGPSGSSQVIGFDIPPEFWRSSVAAPGPDTNTAQYTWGRDPTTGTGAAPNSGVGVTGFSALEWQAPTDIIEDLAAVDGCMVGFYLPYNGRSGYDPPGAFISSGGPGSDVGSFWLSPPPQLVYQPFADPVYAPDYTIHAKEGAQVELDVGAQPLIDALHVNYQTLKGRQLSVVTEDTDVRNYIRAQGYRRAEDYTIDPSVGDEATASSIGQSVLGTRRQPYANATITIELDGASRYPILKGGAQVAKLATVRPGAMHIVDLPASSGLRAGYATHIEWWGQTQTSPEKLTITLGQPGQKTKKHALGRVVSGYLKRRRGRFSAGF